eukprot:TRINITY_DN48768_c0_g1_i1.p1 TRINITY_DN48768_c0_g1~~TRINITY_DN48768_c0_g1_i1.p1  ORF type:complete len:402 (-),score=79.33 TRINITY_DN48768_c0_g1_i1:264-1469(-)
MADLGGLECAAGKWLQRLKREDDYLLPPRALLETVRRREVCARQRAEEHADAERRHAALAQERLEDERRVAKQRLEAALSAAAEAREALKSERMLRIETEVKYSEVEEERRITEQALKTEIKQRKAAEKSRDSFEAEVAEMRALIDDDQCLVALDEFSKKIEKQRLEIESLRARLDVQQKTVATSEASFKERVREFDLTREEWCFEREQLIRERDAVRAESVQLRMSGIALQKAAEETLLRAAEAQIAVSSLASQEDVRDDCINSTAYEKPDVHMSNELADVCASLDPFQRALLSEICQYECYGEPFPNTCGAADVFSALAPPSYEGKYCIGTEVGKNVEIPSTCVQATNEPTVSPVTEPSDDVPKVDAKTCRIRSEQVRWRVPLVDSGDESLLPPTFSPS